MPWRPTPVGSLELERGQRSQLGPSPGSPLPRELNGRTPLLSPGGGLVPPT
jgi:hypothetical protein